MNAHIQVTFSYANITCSTEKNLNHVATLVISLPSKHQGGDVYLSHEGEDRILQTAPLSDTDFQYLCWFTDVVHEIKPVTSGIRLVLTYNLCVHKQNAPCIRYHEPDDPQVRNLRDALMQWANASRGPMKPFTLVYLLEHKYSEANLRFQTLKGSDQLRGSVLQTVAKELGILLYTATHGVYVVSEDRNKSEQPEHKKIFFDESSLRHIRTFEGEEVLARVPKRLFSMDGDRALLPEFPAELIISDEEIIQSDLFSRAADATGDNGFLGNEPSGAEYW